MSLLQTGSPPSKGVHFRQVTIVGVGLIGGSLGLALKQTGMAEKVIGTGRSLKNLDLALTLGAIDQIEPQAQRAVQGSDLVVLATPIEAYSAHVKEWGNQVVPHAIVTDVGSVKGALVEQTESLLAPRIRFVGAHPIAGKEKTGVGVASPNLFQGARCVLTPTKRTDPEALQAIHELWKVAGSDVITMDPYFHDLVLGAVSHLPHVLAFTLMNTLTTIQNKTGKQVDLLRFSGGGLRDTTRIAASSPEMWRDIFLWNHENLLAMIQGFQDQLASFKALLEARDGSGLEKTMNAAKQARERIP